MLDFNVSLEDFKLMLEKPEFKAILYQSEFYYEFEQLGSYGKGLFSLFEDLALKLGRVPSQNEFIKAGFKIAKSHFTDNIKPDKGKILSIGVNDFGHKEYHSFYWNDQLRESIMQRLSRGYRSYLVEYSTILTIKNLFPQYKVGTNSYLDLVAGIDIVVGDKKEDKMLYVHVMSDSGFSNDMYMKKEKRRGARRDRFGNLQFYKRSFKKGHLQLTFTYDDSASTIAINGNPMIKPEHIKNVIELSFNAPNLDSFKEPDQIIKLDEWIKSKNINKNGLGSFWIN